MIPISNNNFSSKAPEFALVKKSESSCKYSIGGHVASGYQLFQSKRRRAFDRNGEDPYEGIDHTADKKYQHDRHRR